jgi:protoheme IX farnesyltransferase
VSTHPETLIPAQPRRSISSLLSTITALFKLRVVALLLFAAAAGAFLGAGEWPGKRPLAVLVLTGGLSAAGASAINEYLEQGIDARMERTKQRPLVSGAITRPRWVPILGGGLVVAPALAVLPSNPALSFFLILGGVIYVVVYTLWLKPRTPLNIVVGGAAGSCAVLSGGAAVGAWMDPGVLGLALLIFLWTPIHFWSLALAYREDYERSGIPMLPVRTTPRRAAWWGMVHGLVGGIVGIALVLHTALGLVYLVPVSVATLFFLGVSGRLVFQPTRQKAWQVFHFSNLYLALVLLCICLDVTLGVR